MSTAEDVARALNRWTREGLDIVGGSDGEALSRLLEDYFDTDTDLPACTSLTHPLHEYS